MDIRGILPSVRSATQEDRKSAFGMLLLPTLLIALLVLSACASISEEECLAADWYSIGVEDGSLGQPMSRIGAYRKDCAEVGVSPDATKYGEGRTVGLESFCTYDRGYDEGKKSSGKTSVCPPGQMQGEFMQGYNAGHYIYEVKQNIRGLERELASMRQEVTKIRSDMDMGYRLDSAGAKHEISTYERDAMYERLLALGKEEGRLEGEISALRASIAGS